MVDEIIRACVHQWYRPIIFDMYIYLYIRLEISHCYNMAGKSRDPISDCRLLLLTSGNKRVRSGPRDQVSHNSWRWSCVSRMAAITVVNAVIAAFSVFPKTLNVCKNGSICVGKVVIRLINLSSFIIAQSIPIWPLSDTGPTPGKSLSTTSFSFQVWGLWWP